MRMVTGYQPRQNGNMQQEEGIRVKDSITLEAMISNKYLGTRKILEKPPMKLGKNYQTNLDYMI